MTPFFSVVIPTLNEEKFLPRLLKDLRSQKDKNFEIIVADANSEDGTREIALKYDGLPIRVFNNQRKNVAYQRNIGAEKTRGRYLVFLDADAGISSTFFSRLHAYIEKKKGLLFLPSVRPYERMRQAKIIFPLVNYFLEASQNFGSPFSTGGSIIIEKNFFHLIGGFNEKLFISEDHDLVQNAYGWGVKAKFMRNITFRFSLRRMKREGQLNLFYKYLVATAHVLLKRQMKRKVFEYEMGGQFYKQNDKKQDASIIIKDYISQIKRFFSKVLSEE